MIVTIPKEPIDESLLPTLTFYHGSIHKLDKILPTAFDVGNKLRDARWSVFMFRKKEYAKYYAMSFMIEQTIKSLKRKQSEFPPTMGWLEKTGINSYEFRGVAMDKNYDDIKNLCLGKKYYVYTLEVPLSTSLDVIGTNPTLPEYTYGGTPKTVRRDEYIITEKDFNKLHKRVSKEEYDKISKEKPFRKPIVSQAFRAFQLDDDTRAKNRIVAIILTRQGDLKPGDDLKFLEDSSIYYRVTYKGEGIYQAVKKAVSKEEWEELLKDPALTWLPKPPKYEEGYESYFTKDGFSKFFATARKVFRNILDDKYIKLSKAKIDNKDIVYKDKYQVVANRNDVIKEETDMMIDESASIHSNEITSSKLPYKCEVKMCHQNYNNGNPRPSAKPTPQLILHKDGKNWRVRAEMLLFKEGKLYLVKQNKVNQYGVTYKLPGGGIDDPQEGIEETASRECKEEALIIPTNVVYTGVEVQHIYDKIPDWHKAILHPEGIYYDGSMTFICTGEYKQEYKSYVKKMDQQDEMTKGHFYTYEQVEGILSKEHKSLFKKYLKDYRRLQFMKEEFIPEIDRSFLDMDISCLVEDNK